MQRPGGETHIVLTSSPPFRAGLSGCKEILQGIDDAKNL